MTWISCASICLGLVFTFVDAEPLSLALQTLEQDLTSDDYHKVLATMIPTDLRAEWQRVGTTDNYLLFARQHGGIEAVLADPTLKQAYERRKQIADQFLNLMRQAYAAKKQKPPFDDPADLQKVLESGNLRNQDDNQSAAQIESILPVEGSERQWARLRGPSQQGTVHDTALPRSWKLLWKTPLPGRGNSQPILWDRHIYLTAEGPRPETAETSPDRFLLAFDRETGEQLWQHAAPRSEGVEKLYWKNTFASSTVATDGERVIAFLGNSGLVCCDPQGQRVWHTDLGLFPTMHGPGTTPVLYEDLVIVVQDQRPGQGESLFAAYDKFTGKLRWKQDRDEQAGWSSPVLLRVNGRDELIYNGSHVVIGYNPATGAELWRVRGTTEESIPSIIAGGGWLYSTSGRNGPIFAIRPGGTGDVSESHVLWKNARGGALVPTPVYHHGRLLLVNDTGILTCYNARSGETVWQQRLRGRFTASPLVVGEEILIVNEDGLATIFRAADQFEALGEHDLGEPILATPALVEGRIYCRSDAHLLCFGD